MLEQIVFDGRLFHPASSFVGIKKDDYPKPFLVVTIYVSRRFKTLGGAIRCYAQQKGISQQLIREHLQES